MPGVWMCSKPEPNYLHTDQPRASSTLQIQGVWGKFWGKTVPNLLPRFCIYFCYMLPWQCWKSHGHWRSSYILIQEHERGDVFSDSQTDSDLPFSKWEYDTKKKVWASTRICKLSRDVEGRVKCPLINISLTHVSAKCYRLHFFASCIINISLKLEPSLLHGPTSICQSQLPL